MNLLNSLKQYKSSLIASVAASLITTLVVVGAAGAVVARADAPDRVSSQPALAATQYPSDP